MPVQFDTHRCTWLKGKSPNTAKFETSAEQHERVPGLELRCGHAFGPSISLSAHSCTGFVWLASRQSNSASFDSAP
jgi:hypothetical protein